MTKELRKAKIRMIKGGRFDNLRISLETMWRPNKRYPVLLFIPDMHKHDHWHVELHKKEAIKLRDYLSAWLGD